MSDKEKMNEKVNPSELAARDIVSGIRFGKELIVECKEKDEPVPVFVYERIIQLQEELIEYLAKGDEWWIV